MLSRTYMLCGLCSFLFTSVSFYRGSPALGHRLFLFLCTFWQTVCRYMQDVRYAERLAHASHSRLQAAGLPDQAGKEEL